MEKSNSRNLAAIFFAYNNPYKELTQLKNNLPKYYVQKFMNDTKVLGELNRICLANSLE